MNSVVSRFYSNFNCLIGNSSHVTHKPNETFCVINNQSRWLIILQYRKFSARFAPPSYFIFAISRNTYVVHSTQQLKRFFSQVMASEKESWRKIIIVCNHTRMSITFIKLLLLSNCGNFNLWEKSDDWSMGKCFTFYKFRKFNLFQYSLLLVLKNFLSVPNVTALNLIFLNFIVNSLSTHANVTICIQLWFSFSPLKLVAANVFPDRYRLNSFFCSIINNVRNYHWQRQNWLLSGSLQEEADVSFINSELWTRLAYLSSRISLSLSFVVALNCVVSILSTRLIFFSLLIWYDCMISFSLS